MESDGTYGGSRPVGSFAIYDGRRCHVDVLDTWLRYEILPYDKLLFVALSPLHSLKDVLKWFL